MGASGLHPCKTEVEAAPSNRVSEWCNQTGVALNFSILTKADQISDPFRQKHARAPSIFPRRFLGLAGVKVRAVIDPSSSIAN